MDDVRFPIGEFEQKSVITEANLKDWIDNLVSQPVRYRHLVAPLSVEQLNTPYRPGGWTLCQLVHHIGDSHMNCMLRIKWALTEDKPTIKPFDQDGFANLSDYREVPIDEELRFIESLCRKWVVLLRSLSMEDMKREFIHPERGVLDVGTMIGFSAWHGEHHLVQIKNTCQQKGWIQD